MSGAIIPLPQYTFIVWPGTILLLPTYCTRRDLGRTDPTTVPSLTYRLARDDGSRTGFRNATLRLIIQQSTEYFWGVTPCRLVFGYRRFEVSPATRQWTAGRCRRRHHGASKLANRYGVTSRETSMTSRIESKAISLCLLSHQQP